MSEAVLLSGGTIVGNSCLHISSETPDISLPPQCHSDRCLVHHWTQINVCFSRLDQFLFYLNFNLSFHKKKTLVRDSFLVDRFWWCLTRHISYNHPESTTKLQVRVLFHAACCHIITFPSWHTRSQTSPRNIPLFDFDYIWIGMSPNHPKTTFKIKLLFSFFDELWPPQTNKQTNTSSYIYINFIHEKFSVLKSYFSLSYSGRIFLCSLNEVQEYASVHHLCSR